MQEKKHPQPHLPSMDCVMARRYLDDKPLVFESEHATYREGWEGAGGLCVGVGRRTPFVIMFRAEFLFPQKSLPVQIALQILC